MSHVLTNWNAGGGVQSYGYLNFLVQVLNYLSLSFLHEFFLKM